MSIIKCEISNIEWVYDDDDDVVENGGKGSDYSLPNIVHMTIQRDWEDITRDEAIDIISDELSNRYGFLHDGFSVDKLEIVKGEK